MTEKYVCRYQPDPGSGDICGEPATRTVTIPGGRYMPVCEAHSLEFLKEPDSHGKRKGRRHSGGRRYVVESMEDTQDRMEQQRELLTAPVTINNGMGIPSRFRPRENSTVREKPEPEARECLLPGCTNLTTHRGGYCSTEHRREHANMARRDT